MLDARAHCGGEMLKGGNGEIVIRTHSARRPVLPHPRLYEAAVFGDDGTPRQVVSLADSPPEEFDCGHLLGRRGYISRIDFDGERRTQRQSAAQHLKSADKHMEAMRRSKDAR